MKFASASEMKSSEKITHTMIVRMKQVEQTYTYLRESEQVIVYAEYSLTY